MTKLKTKIHNPKPFVKWAGGKGQLLNEIRLRYPTENRVNKYCEPFVGGGAVLFDIASQYKLDRILINDINTELMTTYSVIKNDVDSLISALKVLERSYLEKCFEERQEFYYNKRQQFNKIKVGVFRDKIELASLFIFLNRTCFNGLYRVNSKGEFNVPIGNYKNPTICDDNNLREVSRLLSRVTIKTGDYKNCLEFIDEDTFVYIDPPYRPITKTASFTSYTKHKFNDDDQLNLGQFIDTVDCRGAKVILSNSDPTNTATEDDFFDRLYGKYSLERIVAKRMINSNVNNRGNINEILVKNF